jgi:hypothetical protein
MQLLYEFLFDASKRHEACGEIIAAVLCRGVSVEYAKATMHECTDSNVLTGCRVHDRGTLILKACSSDHAKNPVVATDRFTFHAENCEFKNFMVEDLQAKGLQLEGLGTAVLKECRVIGYEGGLPSVALATGGREHLTPTLIAAHVRQLHCVCL